MAADLLVKRERNQVSLYKKWTIVEAYLGSGQDARTYLEEYEKHTGTKIDAPLYGHPPLYATKEK